MAVFNLGPIEIVALATLGMICLAVPAVIVLIVWLTRDKSGPRND